ncbi:hypothetical protein BT63DRAFT_458494 [Microthyrium microscopicum]|uniref:Uncharacterized protein n=1 Tax=Microthyrium microscopicum TaxID=703497 RepID=A0A6A6U3F7_9PEZI|nr:hypothetical protein BT63DRAFT_458494 [Microthyrium microscopicum]
MPASLGPSSPSSRPLITMMSNSLFAALDLASPCDLAERNLLIAHHLAKSNDHYSAMAQVDTNVRALRLQVPSHRKYWLITVNLLVGLKTRFMLNAGTFELLDILRLAIRELVSLDRGRQYQKLVVEMRTLYELTLHFVETSRPFRPSTSPASTISLGIFPVVKRFTSTFTVFTIQGDYAPRTVQNAIGDFEKIGPTQTWFKR